MSILSWKTLNLLGFNVRYKMLAVLFPVAWQRDLNVKAANEIKLCFLCLVVGYHKSKLLNITLCILS